MEITKNDIKSQFYFLEVIDGKYILQYGELISILPKYMFLDKFSSEYSREQTYLFETREMKGLSIKRCVNNKDLIFGSFDDFYNQINNAFFGYSVLLKEREILGR